MQNIDNHILHRNNFRKEVSSMTKNELLEIYNRNYTEEEYYKKNVTYAFSQSQLQDAMKN